MMEANAACHQAWTPFGGKLPEGLPPERRRADTTAQTEVKECCALCGRQDDEMKLRVLGRPICDICERITVALTPRHPLYPFWVSVVKGFYQFP